MVTRPRLMFLMDQLAMPSSQAGMLQYRECLRQAGYDVLFVARDTPEGLELRDRIANLAWRGGLRQTSRRLKRQIRKRWEDRIVELAASCDVVYALKVPSLELHERILATRRPRLLVGMTDAFWLPWFRQHGWSDTHRILELADGVITVNEFTASRIRPVNENVFIVHDSPQTEDFDAVRGTIARDQSRIVLGWVGSPGTVSALFRIWQPLEKLFARDSRFHLRILGTGGGALLNLPRFENVRWSSLETYDQKTMIDEVFRMDIGLFPLFEGDDALARGALKASIYMSGEAIVVAQRYGEVVELVDDGKHGFLAGTDDEWINRILYVADHPAEAEGMRLQALARVRERYSRARTFAQLQSAIESV